MSIHSLTRRAPLLALLAALVVTAAAAVTATAANRSRTATAPGLADARAVVAAALTRPKLVGLKTPVGKAIPTGKKLVFVSCGVTACSQQGPIIATAAKSLGWSSRTVNTDGSPQQLQAAFEAAIRSGASAIILNAMSRSVMEPQIQKAKAKGIPVVTCCSIDKIGNGVVYNTSTNTQNTTIGKYLAAWVVADSQGAANSLYVNISAFQILGGLGVSYRSWLKKWCPACGSETIDIPLSGLNDVPNTIVSYLRSHPDINYVTLSVMSLQAPGLNAALRAAGLSGKVKIIGQGPDVPQIQEIRAGTLHAGVPFDYYVVDYLMVDSLARTFAKVKVPATPPPFWLVTKTNAPNVTTIFPVVTTYKPQFLTLWGKRK
jgi:ABC-type sugar transport system substrate-binding protein